ncbi:MAG: hypothetical protein JNK23_10460 [Opitutaceae bacterium]|nr:hypothetical protein [Opitutaceae bacterium]
MTTHAPIALDTLPPEWLAERRAIIAREGVAVRAGAGPWIEVQSINTGAWLRLALPERATVFASTAERDEALAALVGENPLPDVPTNHATTLHE